MTHGWLLPRRALVLVVLATACKRKSTEITADPAPPKDAAPIAPEVLATGLSGAGPVFVEADAVLVALRTFGDGSDEIVRVPKTGGAAIKVAIGTGATWAISADAKNVYYVEGVAGVLHARDRVTGKDTIAGNTLGCWTCRVVATETELFWNGTQLHTPRRTFVTDASGGFVILPHSIVTLSTSEIVRIDRATSTSTVLEKIESQPLALAANERSAAYTTWSRPGLHIVGHGARRTLERLWIEDAVANDTLGEGLLGNRGRAYLARALARLGVDVEAMAPRVLAVEPVRLRMADGTERPFDVCVWTAGFRASPLPRAWGLSVDSRGRMLVDASLRSLSHLRVYGVGDCAVSTEWVGAPMLMSCRRNEGFDLRAIPTASSDRTAPRIPPGAGDPALSPGREFHGRQHRRHARA